MTIKEDTTIPSDVIKMPVDCDLTETSIQWALDLMGVDITEGAHLFTIEVNERNCADAHAEITAFNRLYDNIVARTKIWKESLVTDEWLITHLESGKSVYSLGA